MDKLLWGRWDDIDLQRNPHLLKTCLECATFDYDCASLEKVTLRKYRNAPACSLFAEDICPECLQPRPDDERVKNGMHCRFCAYGG